VPPVDAPPFPAPPVTDPPFPDAPPEDLPPLAFPLEPPLPPVFCEPEEPPFPGVPPLPPSPDDASAAFVPVLKSSPLHAVRRIAQTPKRDVKPFI